MKVILKTEIPAVILRWTVPNGNTFQTIVMKLTHQFNISCRTSEVKADVPTPDFETMHLLKLPLGYRITYTALHSLANSD